MLSALNIEKLGGGRAWGDKAMCRQCVRSTTESHDCHVMLTDVNIDVVLVLGALLAELHEPLLGAQRRLELTLHTAPSLVLSGQKLPHLPTPLGGHT